MGSGGTASGWAWPLKSQSMQVMGVGKPRPSPFTEPNRECLESRKFQSKPSWVARPVKSIARIATTTAAVAAGVGLAGLSAATDAQAQPGPFPQWCPGEFWDPGWGNNWDWGRCHDDWQGPGGPGGPGWGPQGPGAPDGVAADRADRVGDLRDLADQDGDLRHHRDQAGENLLTFA